MLYRRHDVALLVVFGSVVDGHTSPRDPDLALRAKSDVHVVALLGDLVNPTDCDALDLKDLADTDGCLANRRFGDRSYCTSRHRGS